jgi:hypothetical protein
MCNRTTALHSGTFIKYLLPHAIKLSACHEAFECLEQFLCVCALQCFMEPLKEVQVEGQLMFAEPHDLFGNLDEVSSVSNR